MLEALLMKTGGKSTGTWSTVAPGPSSRTGALAATVDDKVYVFGGFVSNSYPAEFRCYNPDTDTWVNKASGPSGRAFHTMVSVAGKICVYGGSNSGGGSNELWIYDPIANSWAMKTGPSVRADACAAVVGNKIYFCSGTTTAIVPLLNCYDVSTNTWTDLLPIPVAKYRATSAMVAIGTKLYLYGGSSQAATYTRDHWCYDTVTNTWTQLPDGPVARYGHTAVVIDNKIFVFGGMKSSGYADDLWCYDPETNVWISLKVSPLARTGHYAAAAKGKMFVGCGQEWDGLIATTVCYTP